MYEQDPELPSSAMGRLGPAAEQTLPTVSSPFRDRLTAAGDLLIAAALLVFTSPLLALVCCAIKLESPGPVFCRQLRLNAEGRCVSVLRFRTTVHDPDRVSRPIWDAPETRVGEFLHFTRIEQLPQLVNVLRGEMSIVDRDGRTPTFLDWQTKSRRSPDEPPPVPPLL